MVGMETGSQGQEGSQCLYEEEVLVEVPLLQPKPPFMKLLRLAGATSDLFTKKQIVQYLKDYISSRQLFDQSDPRVVHCNEDILGEVFGVQQFTIDDVLGLLEKNCTEKGGTLVKKKRPLLSKPHLLPSVTISITPARNHNTLLYANSALWREPDTERHTLPVNILQSTESSQTIQNQLEGGTSQQKLAASRHLTSSETSLSGVISCQQKQKVKKDTLNLPYVKHRSSSTSSDKQSDISLNHVNQASAESNTDSKSSKKKCKKKKRRNKVQNTDEEPSRKRHVTEPSSYHDNSGEAAGPSRRRGTSLSITYTDDGTDRDDGEFPWYLRLKLANRKQDSEDDDGQSEIYSIQDKETVRVEDSTDDLWFVEEDGISVEVPSDTDFMVEYDLESDVQPVTESDLSSVKSTEGIFLVCKESDVEFFADCSDSNSNNSDNELTEADNWCCPDCKNTNHPFQRFCGKCWKVRSDWLPSGQNRADVDDFGCGKKGEAAVVDGKNNSEVDQLIVAEVMKASMTDSGFGSTQASSQESTDQAMRWKDNSADRTFEKLTLPSMIEYSSPKSPIVTETQELESRHAFANIQVEKLGIDIESVTSNTIAPSITPSATQARSNTESKLLDDPCMICLSRPKTASLIHGTTGHQVCCFTCAKRLKRRGQDCPVCRRSIQKVIRNYIL